MYMRTPLTMTMLIALAVLLATGASAFTLPDRTTHHGMRVLPAPGGVTVDGKTDDWDLSGGMFACKGISKYRRHYACWFHTMYDAQNIYVLARWNDPTPMNNPDTTDGGTGFDGDGLQVRFITASGTPQEHVSHVTAWYSNTDKNDVVNFTYGRRFNEGQIPDAQTRGARQAFLKHPNGKGYNQEISLPWKLLTKDGAPLKAGDKFATTIQLNFSYGWRGRYRLYVIDIFKPDAWVDRGSIHQDCHSWGGAALEPKGNVDPWPVRLFDGRMFGVKMNGATPVIDWTAPLADKTPIRIVSPPRLQPVRHLGVQSEPIAGISITGDKPGDTNYTAICEPDDAVSLSAPTDVEVEGKRYDFVCWKVDADEGPDALLEAEITMDMDHVATAVYAIQTCRLTVQSEPVTGVAIAGDTRGVTNYSVLCISGERVNLTAPASKTVDGTLYSFVRWVVNDEKKPDGIAHIVITTDSDRTAVAVYGPQETEAIGEGDNTKLYAAIIAGGLILVAVLGVVAIRLTARRR